MTFVITQSCCNDALCTAVCPVGCIHPAPEDPDFGHAEMLYIDPNRCIDCAACADVCPVDAIHADDELPSGQAAYVAINAEYFRDSAPVASSVATTTPPETMTPLTVAIVGAGPSGFYAAAALLDAAPRASISLIDRLPTPYGLVRAGVAPDHQDTKRIATTTFAAVASDPRLTAYFGVEVGTDLDISSIAAHHHATIYATGAADGRRLGIPGEDLPGVFTAAEVVGWYNGHPDHAGAAVSGDHTTTVVVGNGNVALDVARVLLLGGHMRHTDIADHALEALSGNAVRDVLILGRRGPEHAAFTLSQLLALTELDGVDIIVDQADLDGAIASPGQPYPATFASEAKLTLLRQLSLRAPIHDKRIHLKFTTTLAAIHGTDRAEAVTLASSAQSEVISTGMVVSCVGFDGRPIPGVPFDHNAMRIPHSEGRVLDDAGGIIAGHYVTGWIKRGPSGVIGTNKRCAAETVAALLDDHHEGVLGSPPQPVSAFEAMLRHQTIDRRGWLRIDEREQRRGRESGRPRRKSADRSEMVAVASDQPYSGNVTPLPPQQRRTP